MVNVVDFGCETVTPIVVKCVRSTVVQGIITEEESRNFTIGYYWRKKEEFLADIPLELELVHHEDAIAKNPLYEQYKLDADKAKYARLFTEFMISWVDYWVRKLVIDGDSMRANRLSAAVWGYFQSKVEHKPEVTAPPRVGSVLIMVLKKKNP